MKEWRIKMTQDVMIKKNRGNFLELVEFLSKYVSHLQRTPPLNQDE